MSRYIDADALKEHIEVITYEGMWHESEVDEFVSVENIDNAPSIDIVFCKECKHNYNTCINHGKMQPRCDFTDRVLTENDYCSRGEREDE